MSAIETLEQYLDFTVNAKMLRMIGVNETTVDAFEDAQVLPIPLRKLLMVKGAMMNPIRGLVFGLTFNEDGTLATSVTENGTERFTYKEDGTIETYLTNEGNTVYTLLREDGQCVHQKMLNKEGEVLFVLTERLYTDDGKLYKNTEANFSINEDNSFTREGDVIRLFDFKDGNVYRERVGISSWQEENFITEVLYDHDAQGRIVKVTIVGDDDAKVETVLEWPEVGRFPSSFIQMGTLVYTQRLEMTDGKLARLISTEHKVNPEDVNETILEDLVMVDFTAVHDKRNL